MPTTINPEELQTMKETELKELKLRLEIADFKDNKRFERNKLVVDNRRTIILSLLTAFISLIGLGSTIWLKYLDRRDIQATEGRKRIDGLIDKFYEAEENTAKQNKIACQIAQVPNPLNDESIRKSIEEFKIKCESLTQLVPDLKIAKDSANNIVAQLKTDTTKASDKPLINELNKSDDKLIALQNQKNAASTPTDKQKVINEITAYKKQSLTLLPDTLLKSAITLTDTISNNLVQQYAVISAGSNENTNKKISKDYGVSWFKVGYFLQFENMRILLQYLDRNLGIQVQICNTTGSNVCSTENAIATKKWISFNQPYTVPVGGNTYEISLKTIDRAGNNPFKLAAYISVVKL